MYCLTDAQVQIILTMIDYIGWPTRWFSSEATIDPENLLAMQGNLARTLMSGCCDDPVLATRTNTDTGEIEVTTDGTTWTPAQDQGLDPRYTSPELPPLPDEGSEDNRCRAATNVVQAVDDKVQDFGTQLGSFGTILALAGGIALAIVGVFTVPPSATILVPIVIALAQAIFELTTEEYLGLFSSGIYDDLQCILYENCGEDGTFTEQNVLDILTAIDSTFSGNVALTFSSTIKGWQVPGLNAAARGGSLSTGDCTDCAETCWTDWEAVLPTGGVGAPWGEVLSKVGNVMTVTGTEVAPGLFRAMIGNVSNSNCQTYSTSGVVGSIAAGACGVDNLNMPSDSSLWFTPGINSNMLFIAENGSNFTVTVTCTS